MKLEEKNPLPGLKIYENFIPDNLHDNFVKQMKFGIAEINVGHYDGYSFPDDLAFDAAFFPLIEYIFAKMKQLNVFPIVGASPLRLGCSLVGYKKNGFILKHIDNHLLSGSTVVVLSFNSPVVINFYKEVSTELITQKFFIPPKSLYIMANEIRYNWSHEIKANENTYNDIKFQRDTRYSVLFFEPGPMYNGEILYY